MNTKHLSALALPIIAAVIGLPSDVRAQQGGITTSTVDHSAVNKMIAEWPNRPKLGAKQMLAKYGMPSEVTSERLVWHNRGPYKRITVTKAEHHHDFPKPHMDYIEHTIPYRVPVDKAGALSAYDGSLTFDRTRGEMSARCDLEGHNILTLNLAHDIVMGKSNAEAARTAFGQNVVDDAKGKYPPYTTTLRFDPKGTEVMFADTPVIAGSPERPMADTQSRSKDGSGDGEILGVVGAINENEIVAALEAGKKSLSPEIAAYAKRLHREHGKSLEATLQLGQKIKVTPMETAAVDTVRTKGAGELAALALLDGSQFGSAYVTAMIMGHTEVLDMIDNQLMKRASSDAVKKHLTDTRNHVANHLAEGKALEANVKR
jgi:predicted outer membrane protein